MQQRCLRSTAVVLAALSLSLSSPAPRAPSSGIKLVLLLTVDQMRPDYLTRFADQYTGGLKYLGEHGRIHTAAFQDHAFTKTAAGHGTILSGLHPAHSGIIGNDWYDRSRRKMVYCTDDPDDPSIGHSPRALAGTTLGDWLRKVSPESKVVTIARKDRSAVLLAGQNPTGTFWFETSIGEFVTSPYYKRDLPAWVQSFNAERRADRYLRTAWTRLLPTASDYSRSTPDDQEGEGDLGGRVFPHAYRGRKADSGFYNFLVNTPFMDELQLDLAREGVRGEALGKRGVADLLALSLASTDAVGHKFGPDSQEMHDMILRLDRYLGDFFLFLDREVGMANVLVVLTADHGAQPLPEVASARGARARRLVGEMPRVIQGLEASLAARFGKGPWVTQAFHEGIYLNDETIRRTNRTRAEIEKTAARFLRRTPFVEDVFTRTELLSRKPHATPYTRFVVNAFHPRNSGDLLLLVKENHLVTTVPTGTDHGMPYAYDSQVPIVFAGAGIAAGPVASRARTVDIAPTIAALLGIAVPAGLDGRPLLEAQARAAH